MNKLTAKEEEVMEYIWQLGECAPKDVHSLYSEPRPLINGIQNQMEPEQIIRLDRKLL